MNSPQQLSTDTMFTVLPIRYSVDPPATVAFLRTLGLAQLIGTAQGQYAELAGASGQVLVHSTGGSEAGAAPGRTNLCFKVADAGEAAERLGARGFDVTVWDESYGKHAGIRDYRGGGLWINEEMTDLYGYERATSVSTPTDIDVTAVYYTTDFAAARSFFAQLGFAPNAAEDSDYLPLRAGNGSGVLGLHAIDTDPPLGPPSSDDPMSPSAAAIHLGFETGKDPQTLTRRLRQAGYTDARLIGDPIHLTVSDPDGCSVEIFPRG
jgi:hypothetical protein